MTQHRQPLRLEQIERPDDERLIDLIAASDAYHERLYPPESNHSEPLAALVGGAGAFFAGFLGSSAVACGGVRLQADDVDYGEIKKLYVAEAQRGRRFAEQVMQRLEEYVRDRGIVTMRLETGPRQPEALQFYRRLGYRERGPFGQYSDDPLSIFMEKALAAVGEL